MTEFHKAVGNREVHQISFQDIADYVLRLPFQPVIKKHYRRDIKGVFAWWIERGWAV